MMRSRVPAKRNTKRAPKPRAEQWCTRDRIAVPNPGLQRCPRCGRRIRAFPTFDDGMLGFPFRKLAKGVGRDTPLRELATGRGTRAERLKHAAEQWWLGPHKLK